MVLYNRRKYERIKVDWPVQVISLNDKTTTYYIQLIDISSGGMSFTCTELTVNIGDILIVRFPFASLKIKIVWCQEKRYGAMFMDPVGKLIITQYLYLEST